MGGRIQVRTTHFFIHTYWASKTQVYGMVASERWFSLCKTPSETGIGALWHGARSSGAVGDQMRETQCAMCGILASAAPV